PPEATTRNALPAREPALAQHPRVGQAGMEQPRQCGPADGKRDGDTDKQNAKKDYGDHTHRHNKSTPLDSGCTAGSSACADSRLLRRATPDTNKRTASRAKNAAPRATPK